VTEAGARTLRCVATFASDNPAGAAQIREIGLYASSNVTTGLVARQDLTGANSVNKGASDSINVSYDVVFTTAS
jgi:cytochrome b